MQWLKSWYARLRGKNNSAGAIAETQGTKSKSGTGAFLWGAIKDVTTFVFWPIVALWNAATGLLTGRAGKICLWSVPAAALIQFAPQLTTRSLDKDIEAKKIPVTLQENFHTEDIRVYHRYNPLQIFHQAGHLTALNFDKENLYRSLLLSPVIYVGAFAQATGTFFFPAPIDAFSIAPDHPIDTRSCFIRPPKAQTASDFVESFGRFTEESLDFTFKSDPQKLSKVFYTFVMAHEARHCDQDKDMYGSSLNEADADLFAFRLLEQKMQDKAEIAEAKEIMQHLRHILAIRGDLGHFSTVSLQRGSQTPMQAELEYSVPETLRRIMSQAIAKNNDLLPVGSATQKIYAIGKHMLKAGTFKPVKGDTAETAAFKAHLQEGVQNYIKGVDYFNKLSGGKILKWDTSNAPFDLRYLHKNYLPVPDKLKAPVKPAA